MLNMILNRINSFRCNVNTLAAVILLAHLRNVTESVYIKKYSYDIIINFLHVTQVTKCVQSKSVSLASVNTPALTAGSANARP